MIKILLDMNLIPLWIDVFEQNKIHCLHWMNIGKYTAKDEEIIKWAVENEYSIFTHDLDFGKILSLTNK